MASPAPMVMTLTTLQLCLHPTCWEAFKAYHTLYKSEKTLNIYRGGKGLQSELGLPDVVSSSSKEVEDGFSGLVSQAFG